MRSHTNRDPFLQKGLLLSNLAFGWLSIGLGFASGAILGIYFRSADWLGGYDALRRRLVRLGHIAFIGLGIINILYEVTIPYMTGTPTRFAVCHWGFIIGAIAMPLSCFATAWRQWLHPLFVIPVTSLVTAAVMTILGVLRI